MCPLKAPYVPALKTNVQIFGRTVWRKRHAIAKSDRAQPMPRPLQSDAHSQSNPC